MDRYCTAYLYLYKSKEKVTRQTSKLTKGLGIQKRNVTWNLHFGSEDWQIYFVRRFVCVPSVLFTRWRRNVGHHFEFQAGARNGFAQLVAAAAASTLNQGRGNQFQLLMVGHLGHVLPAKFYAAISAGWLNQSLG
jgi:hypothetical protein